jgi:hypothetical protein
MRPDGSFSFHGLVPGPYILQGFGTPGGQPGMAGGEMWGTAEVTVDGGNATKVSLQMRRGVTVSGTLAAENITPALAMAGVRVTLDPIPGATDWEMASVTATPDKAGRFSMTNVLPGQYRFRITGLPAGWTLASAVFDEKDAADYHLSIDGSRNLAGGVLKFTSRTGSIAGRVTNATGQPSSTHAVIVFPDDRRLWLPQSRRIRTVQPGLDGRYGIGELPAGEYRIVAVLDAEPGQAFDAEFLSRLVGIAQAITVAEGETLNLELRTKN